MPEFHRVRFALALPLAALAVLVPAARAQQFQPGFVKPGVTGTAALVRSLLVHDDGSGPSLFVGGQFGTAGTATIPNIARWDGDWHIVGTQTLDGAQGPVHAMTIYNGDLIAAGQFAFARTGGSSIIVNNIARWDGSVWSALGGGLGGTVNAVAAFDGDLYVGGSFFTAGGAPASRIARWDGTGWSALGTGVGGIVHALEVFDGGSGPELHVGGFFSDAGGTGVANIARWDGTSWSALPDAGVGGPVYALRDYDFATGTHDLYVGGQFTSAAGGTVTARNLVRFDGLNWWAIEDGAPPGEEGTDGSVRGLFGWTDGLGDSRLFVGGDFDSVSGFQSSRAAAVRRKPGGELEFLHVGAVDNRVSAFAAYDDGRGTTIFAGGVFDRSIAGFEAPAERLDHLARWQEFYWRPMGWGANASPLAGADLDANECECYSVVLGGSFTLAGGLEGSRVLMMDRGELWKIPGGGSPDGEVRALAVPETMNGCEFYAAGSFTAAGGTPALNVAVHENDVWMPLGAGLDGQVNALAWFQGQLHAGGHFSSSGATPLSRLGRWDGMAWQPLGTGITSGASHVLCLEAGMDGYLYVGGDFTSIGGANARSIARWDGTTYEPLVSGLAVNGVLGSVYALHQRTPGSLYIAGAFGQVGTQSIDNIVEYFAPGEEFFDLGGTDGTVLALEEVGANLYVGGIFTTAGGVPATNLARYDWSADSWFAVDGGTDGTVRLLHREVAAGDGFLNLVVGGGFEKAGARASSSIGYIRAPDDLGPRGVEECAAATAVAELPPSEVHADAGSRLLRGHRLPDGRAVMDLTLPQAAHVRLDVYDVSGRRVARLLDTPRRPGTHRVDVDSSLPRAAGGVYFGRAVVRMAGREEIGTTRVILIR